MLTKDQLEDLRRIAEETRGAFAEACSAPNISVEDYNKLRDQYNDARWRYYEHLMAAQGH